MRNPVASAREGGSKTTPCCSKVGLKRGPWTPEEDELLSNYIRREGEGRWRTLPKRAGLLRCGKSCRLRWMNYLRPSVKRGQIAPDEEDLILRLHRLLGNRWSLIAGRIPGRTDNEIKNYWNTHLSKKLISQGIDPRTHKPLNPNPNSHPPAPPAPNPNLNPNPNPISKPQNTSSALEDIGKDGNGYFPGTELDRNDATSSGGCRNSDGLVALGSQTCHRNGNEDDDMVYCTDEVFSSFMNSLITDDMFLQQHHHHQHHQNLVLPSDPFISSAPNFSYSAIWDASIFSPTALNEDDHGRFADTMDRRL